MNTYEIDVNVDTTGSKGGGAFQVEPNRQEVLLSTRLGKVENALVTWTFKNLPADVTPAITFDSPDVIASGPTTTLGDAPQITCEIGFPARIRKDLLEYPAQYRVSLSPSSAKKTETFPPPIEEPSLVVIRSPDPPPPPSNGKPVRTAANAKT